MKTIRSKNYLLAIMLIIIIVLFCISRVTFLDRDLPPWQVTNYQPIDEFYYTISAFNIYHYGQISHKVVSFIPDDGNPLDMLETIMTAATLKSFGNNYFGLRMASVICSLLTLLLVYLTLKKILVGRNRKSYNISIVLALLYMTFDFSFLMSGRVAEPTIFRMLALALVIYIGSLKGFNSILKSPLLSYLLGFLSVSAVLYVYIYNAFIALGMFSTIIFWSYAGGKVNVFKQLSAFILGGISSLITYDIFVSYYYHMNLLETYFRYIFHHDGLASLNIIDNLSFIFTTNIFRFNISVLFLTLVSLPVFIIRVCKKHDNLLILVLNLFCSLVVQSWFVNDYSFRKLVIFIPLITIILVASWDYMSDFRDWIEKNEYLKWIGIIYILGAGTFSFYQYLVTTNRSFIYPIISKYNYINLGVFCIVFFAILLLFRFKLAMGQSLMIFVLLLTIIVPSSFMDIKYVYANPTYMYRNAMISLSNKINGKIVAGSLSYGVRLYNTSIPVLNPYVYLPVLTEYNSLFRKVFDNGLATYSISYDRPNAKKSLDDLGMKLIDEYDFNLVDSKSEPYMGLFVPNKSSENLKQH
ncbi:MAG: hypothetical protein M0Z55_05750 [Peptococcaceae bacterium]|nr:hypothetical protein [Peptococcaceae bacterium]